jgi:Fe-S-cluster containining protein
MVSPPVPLFADVGYNPEMISEHAASDELSRRVLDIYRAADADVLAAAPVCVASGRCCRFKEYGHTLFLSGLEADVLLAGAPPWEGPVSADFCPFQKGGLCTARGPRPLACRVYFCDPAYQEAGVAISEKYLRRLKELANEFDLGWRYAPLHHFLAEALERRVAAQK